MTNAILRGKPDAGNPPSTRRVRSPISHGGMPKAPILRGISGPTTQRCLRARAGGHPPRGVRNTTAVRRSPGFRVGRASRSTSSRASMTDTVVRKTEDRCLAAMPCGPSIALLQKPIVFPSRSLPRWNGPRKCRLPMRSMAAIRFSRFRGARSISGWFREMRGSRFSMRGIRVAMRRRPTGSLGSDAVVRRIGPRQR